jgi:hypothetical protein
MKQDGRKLDHGTLEVIRKRAVQRALASRKGTGRPRKLTAEQERQVFRWINAQNREKARDPEMHSTKKGNQPKFLS